MLQPERIASAANPLIKDVRRAVNRGGLTSAGLCVAETPHLLAEALRGPCQVKHVLAAESAAPQLPRLPGIRLSLLPDVLFGKISSTETSQGVIALVEPVAWEPAQLLEKRRPIVVLDSLQDPGNAGAIVRAAEAFGAAGVLFLKGTASPYHPKTLRASAGSLFRVPFLHGMDAAQARTLLEQHGVALYAAVPPRSTARDLAESGLAGACALVIGNEGRGVGAEWRGIREVFIPTAGVESLNAAMAAGILLYEAHRQRAQRP